ncbi:uncharacterized protein BJX67DRAFT_347503 [Aspergillus lucknowensis]|uniref:Initiation-specific alpha-1,6-mannosyltransferase n=1 Tax=Aspergillus lucknowensis TaxID=176173 RepID=A0ABR4LYG9_9EURO
MLTPRKQKLFVPFLIRRRLFLLLLLLLVLVFFVVLRCLPTGNNHIVSGKWLPDYDVEATPRYLHRSSYRKSPDYAYERSVSEALQSIERDVLEGNGGQRLADARIWQIRLGDYPVNLDRGPDSLMFENVNSEWEYQLVTDTEADRFITTVLAAVPELKTLYDSYPYHVIRSDLLRYLLLWYYGGYYADMDVFPAKSIKSCPSLAPLFAEPDSRPNVSLVVGIEIDEPHASPQLMRDWHWIRTYGLIQYTIYAPQRFSPLLREVIVRVLAHTRQHNKYSLPLIGPRYNEKTILEVTGPGVFTDAILDALSDGLPTAHSLIEESVESDKGIGDLVGPSGEISKRVTWAPFHTIREPLCVDAQEAAIGKSFGGLCVLPINAWGNGQRHSGAENFRSRHACVNHRFGGTWKKDWWSRHFG